jgi:hypothetical protein
MKKKWKSWENKREKYWSNEKLETKHEEVEKTKEKGIDQMKRIETKKKKFKLRIVKHDCKLITRGGVSHCGLAIYIKRVLRQKKNYGNSNISPCKNIIFKKIV